MNKQIRYEFSSGNLLEEPNTYFYSQFQGKEFLVAWRNEREKAFNTQHSGNESLDIKNSNLTSPTEISLNTIKQNLKKGNPPKNEIVCTDILLKKFEVSKRIYTGYSENWKPLKSATYSNMQCYLLFSEILDIFYFKTLNLKYLNALLKCIDILIARKNELNTKQIVRLKQLIERERGYIESLTEKYS